MELKSYQKIFSITNDLTTYNKVITIFGFQIKIKSNKLIERKNSKILFKHFSDFVESYNDILSNSKDNIYTPIKGRLCYCIAYSLPYINAGYTTRSQYMAKELNKKFDLFVITRPGFPWNLKNGKDYSECQKEEIIEDVKYIRQKTLMDDNSISNITKKYEQTFLDLKPEYVISASNHAHALPIMCACKKLGIPFYYEVRGFWELTKASKDENFKDTLLFKYEKFAESMICKQANHVFTLTTPMKKELILRGVDENKISLVPNCADLSRFDIKQKNKNLLNKLNIPENVPVIGYIGSIQQYEGIDDLISACGILHENKIDFRLLIIGGSTELFDYKKYLLNLAKKLNLKNKVIMLDRVKPEEVSEYYSLIDIAPFGRKPFEVCELVSPIKPLEAMSMQKAVIVSNVEALKEIVIDNVTGLHFEKGNVNSYAKTLEKLILNENLRRELGYNARKWIEENRKWENNAKTMKQILLGE